MWMQVGVGVGQVRPRERMQPRKRLDGHGYSCMRPTQWREHGCARASNCAYVRTRSSADVLSGRTRPPGDTTDSGTISSALRTSARRGRTFRACLLDGEGGAGAGAERVGLLA